MTPFEEMRRAVHELMITSSARPRVISVLDEMKQRLADEDNQAAMHFYGRKRWKLMNYFRLYAANSNVVRRMMEGR